MTDNGHFSFPVERPRICLLCGCEFNSTGPGNRICSNCKAKKAKVRQYDTIHVAKGRNV
jgi:hypothetical protein